MLAELMKQYWMDAYWVMNRATNKLVQKYKTFIDRTWMWIDKMHNMFISKESRYEQLVNEFNTKTK